MVAQIEPWTLMRIDEVEETNGDEREPFAVVFEVQTKAGRRGKARACKRARTVNVVWNKEQVAVGAGRMSGNYLNGRSMHAAAR